jgi:aminodeoxyfutalosine deaminase
MEEFVAGLPKAELHVHHIGSAPLRVVVELAARHPGTVPADPADLARFFVFSDFRHFIRSYLAVVRLVRTADDVRLLTFEVARDMAGQNIRYAELTVTPGISTGPTLPVPAFLEALEDARAGAARDLGVELRWIFDFPAAQGVPAAEAALAAALDHDVPGLVGFGVGGSEVGFPRSLFRDQFDRARAAGLHSVPHAGETTGPESVWDAVLALGAERVEHGITAAQDPALLAHLVEHDVVLDVCPTSNVALGVVPSLAEHPLPTLVGDGVRVSVNTDDPPMVGTDLGREYALAADLLGLDATGLAGLARTAVEASFAPDAFKATLRAEISAYVARAARA